MKKRRKNDSGSLDERENIAERDYRGKNRSVKKDDIKAPDGISGDWS